MADEASSTTRRRRAATPIPDWQRDPHQWLDYSSDSDKNPTARVFVQLHGLQSRAELNGHVALCVGYDPSVRRYRVQLCGGKNAAANNNNHSSILSVPPDKVQRATAWQHVYGKALILASQRHQIHADARTWVRRTVPVGLLAGHAGPTDAQVDAALVKA